jgi:quinol-cytochrome oxidoreductase complex cytochrome b subunit
MRLARIRPFDWLAGAAGVALLVVLALPWYDMSDGSHSAFQQFTIVDLWLALTALLAISVPVITAMREGPSLAIAATVVAEAVSWIAVLLALWRAIDQPGGPLEPTAMPWVALVVTLAISVTVWLAMRDERAPGIRQPPEVRIRPAPPPDGGHEPSPEPT